MLSIFSILFVLGLLIGGALLLTEGMWTLRKLYERGGEQHWDRLAERVSLLHGHDDRGRHVLDGQRDGVWLHVAAEGAWMVVRGRIEVPMPGPMRISHPNFSGRAARIRTGNPILDAHLWVEGEPDIAGMLQDPDLAGALLAVVHAWPGSHVDERYVVLRYPDTLGRSLQERCQAVVELVLALRSASRNTRRTRTRRQVQGAEER